MPLRREPNWQTTMSRMISAASCFERQPCSDTWVLSLLTCREESSMRLTTWAVSWFANVPKWWLRNEFLAGSMAHNSECSIDSRRRKFCFLGNFCSEENGSSFSCVWEIKWDMFELKTREMMWKDWLTQKFVVCWGWPARLKIWIFSLWESQTLIEITVFSNSNTVGLRHHRKFCVTFLVSCCQTCNTRKSCYRKFHPFLVIYSASSLKCTQGPSKIGCENFVPITHYVVTPNASLLHANRATIIKTWKDNVTSRHVFRWKWFCHVGVDTNNSSWRRMRGKNQTEVDFHFICRFMMCSKKKKLQKQNSSLEVTA